jgi:hypothetical protein
VLTHFPFVCVRAYACFVRHQVRACFAVALRDLAQSGAHPSVRAQALLLVSRINQEMRAFGVVPSKASASEASAPAVQSAPPRPRGMSALAQAHWQVFCNELNKEEKQSGGTISCAIM